MGTDAPRTDAAAQPTPLAGQAGVAGGADDVDAEWARLVATELGRFEPVDVWRDATDNTGADRDGADRAGRWFSPPGPDAGPDELDDDPARLYGAAADGLHRDDPHGVRDGPHSQDGLDGVVGPIPGVDGSRFAGVVPGTELAVALDAARPAGLSVHELADTVAAWERMIAWCAAKQAEAVAELTHRRELRPDDGGGRFSSLHPVPVTAAALCVVWPWTKPQAEKLVDQAVTLVEDYPGVHRALDEGRLDVSKARIVTRALTKCDPDVAALIQKAVLPFVHTWTEVKLSRVINELLHELDTAGTKRRHRQARDRRGVWVEPGEDGMAWLIAYLPAEEATAIMAALNAATTHNPHPGHGSGTTRNPHPEQDTHTEHGARTEQDPRTGRDTRTEHGARTRGQRRADALASFGWMSLTTGHLGGRECASCGAPAGTRLSTTHARPVTVNLTLPMSTLLGLDEHPAHLDGYGPIDADTTRTLAATGVWRWVGTHPAGGHALNYGTTRYTPPQELVDFVLLRDRECIAPGCHHPAQRCEIDHRTPWPNGPTSACNCSALCKPCHIQKHRAGWTIQHLGNGRQQWTSPTGHTSTVTLPRIAPNTPTQTNPTNTGPQRPTPT
ncbi:HNH endonuclease signature motif containing protein [Phytoactinopolyspora limicola]|uniref:HNH endonuclease signature motif containing protein n=1 Tax=Phytoactinopolyspora limicola TaxID=2715536 RepID=UPI00140B5AF2|nr:HNH endonuclease signature motif containing protein [Phytoactinopolyspora limicola]